LVEDAKVSLNRSGLSNGGVLPWLVEHLIIKVGDACRVGPADKVSKVLSGRCLVGDGLSLVEASRGPADLSDPYGLALGKVGLDVIVSTDGGRQSTVDINSHPEWEVVVHVDILDGSDVSPTWVAGTDSVDVSNWECVSLGFDISLYLFDLCDDGIGIEARDISSVEILCADRETQDIVESVFGVHRL